MYVYTGDAESVVFWRQAKAPYVAQTLKPKQRILRPITDPAGSVRVPNAEYVPSRIAATFAAALQAQASVTAGLTTAIHLASAPAAQATVTAALTTAIKLAATASAQSSVTASLTTGIHLAAQLGASASVSATMGGSPAAFAASLGSSASVTATLSTAIHLAANLASQPQVTAALTASGFAWAAIMQAQASASASLSTQITMGAAFGARSSITANLLAIPVSVPFSISLTEDQTFQTLRSFLLYILPSGTEVIKSQTNRVPMPAGPNFVTMTPILRERIATNETTWNDAYPLAGSRQDMQSTKFTIQLDVYGPASGDNVQIITTLFRSSVAFDQFQTSGFAVTPLYAGDAQQLPFDNDQQQIDERWKVDVYVQVKPVVTSPQDFASSLYVGLINVDAVFPP